MEVKIIPSRLSGVLDAISSKSFAHRFLICAALAEETTRIRFNCLSDDIHATIRCLKEMGCGIKIENDIEDVSGIEDANGIEDAEGSLIVEPLRKASAPSVVLSCGESGTTARFMLPLAAHLFDSFTLKGEGRLPLRPFASLCKTLSAAGCNFDGDRLPLTGTGKIRAGDFAIEGNISSQFISGLLFVLPLLDADSRVTLTTPLESAAYVDMTIAALSLFGIKIEKTENTFFIKGKQRYNSPADIRVEGDWSNAAFFLCAAAMNGSISLRGLSPDSIQGDRAVLDILRRFGAQISGSGVTAGTLRGIDIDASQIPDLVPVLAVTSSVAAGQTRIYNAGRLRIKESDRIQSTFNLLSGLGADIETTADGLLVRGKEKLRGGTVDGSGDHRIVMAAAAASCVCENPVVIKGAEAVNKSYPMFFEHFRRLGGNAIAAGNGN